MRDELATRWEKARTHVESRWDEDDVERELRRLKGRMRRRGVARGAAVFAGPLVLVAILAFGLGRWSSRQHLIASTPIPGEQGWPRMSETTLYFDDGSFATALNAESHLVAEEVSQTRVRVRLERGGARFDVTPRPERLFEVDAGQVAVLVLGTSFSVNRRGAGVEVLVDRGRVRVAWDGDARVLSGGEGGLFPPPPPLQEVGDETPPPRRSSPSIVPSTPTTEGVETWQALARDGRNEDAFIALERAGGAGAPRSMTEALLAYDVARGAGHDAVAARILLHALERFPRDGGTPIANFQLGRALLREGRPREAAGAFARYRQLAPDGAFAEDALAHEVECWARAGAADLARRRAEDYVARFPNGRRLRRVRQQGGL